MTLPPRLADKPLDPEGVKTSDMMWAYMETHFPAELAAVEKVAPHLRENIRRRKHAPGVGLSSYRQKADELTHYRCWAEISTCLNGAKQSYTRAVRKQLSGEGGDVAAALHANDVYEALLNALDPVDEFYGVKLNKDLAKQVDRSARDPERHMLQGYYRDALAVDYSNITLEAFDAALADLEKKYFPPEPELESA